MDARIPDSTSGARSLLLRRSLMALLVGGLALLCMLVLRPFLAPMAWATILAYATWPLYCRFRAPFRKLTTAAAAAMTLLALYDKIYREDILAHAYAQCRSNQGAPV